jgi:hypothetical protein
MADAPAGPPTIAAAISSSKAHAVYGVLGAHQIRLSWRRFLLAAGSTSESSFGGARKREDREIMPVEVVIQHEPA